MGDSCLAGNLFELMAQIPDPRGRRGRRHPLVAMLTTIVCAILTGARGYRAIAHWARSQNAPVWQWLGFNRKPPCANSFRNLLLALKPEVLGEILQKWMAAIVQLPTPSAIQSVAMDGKTLCNTLATHQRNVQLLSLLDQATGGVLSQQAVPPTTNEAKTAVNILKTIILKGRLVTGDAMFCQRELCEQIVDSGGDYLFVVKDNQPELKAAVAAEFQPGFSPATEKQRRASLSEAQTASKGHGRTVQRNLQASARLAGHLDWPGLPAAEKLPSLSAISATAPENSSNS